MDFIDRLTKSVENGAKITEVATAAIAINGLWLLMVPGGAEIIAGAIATTFVVSTAYQMYNGPSDPFK